MPNPFCLKIEEGTGSFLFSVIPVFSGDHANHPKNSDLVVVQDDGLEQKILKELKYLTAASGFVDRGYGHVLQRSMQTRQRHWRPR
jgi:hypothetical protein